MKTDHPLSSNLVSATEILQESCSVLEERAKLRDSESTGERSMKDTVAAFNAARGKDLSEADGWAFMILLKLVRSGKGKFHKDDYVDGASYFSLLGECDSLNRL